MEIFLLCCEKKVKFISHKDYMVWKQWRTLLGPDKIMRFCKLVCVPVVRVPELEFMEEFKTRLQDPDQRIQ